MKSDVAITVLTEEVSSDGSGLLLDPWLAALHADFSFCLLDWLL
jgi:hypothetical protein